MFYKKILFLFVIALSLSTTVLLAQPKFASPYSRFGLGDLVNQNFTPQRSYGNLGTAFHEPLQLNTVNPASYGFLQATAFDIGVGAKYANLKDEQRSTNVWSGGLNNLGLGFALKNPINAAFHKRKVSPWGIGMGFTLMPYSAVGYNITTIKGINSMDTAAYNYQGYGGANRILWSTGVRYKEFSLGITLGRIFGKMNYDRIVTLPDVVAAFEDHFTDNISITGTTLNLGAQYDYFFKKKKDANTDDISGKYITFGITFAPSMNFSTKSDQLYYRRNVYYAPSTSTASVLTDTLVKVSEKAGTGKLPGELGLGVMFGELNKWKFGLDYNSTKWSKYTNTVRPENLFDAWRLGFGGELIPDYNSYNRYAKRIRYRLGGFYALDNRSIGGTQLKNYALTLGLGMPIILPRQQATFINWGLEIGKLDGAALKETYFKLSLGFSLNDNTWFYKQKFN